MKTARHTRPFPFTVIDGMFDYLALSAAVAEFPTPDDERWYTFDSDGESGKQQLVEPGAVWTFPNVASVLDVMYGESFLDDLTALTGVEELIPDVVGGGMHQTLVGGRLNMHVDSATDFGERTLYRRLNVLLYLNDDWTGGGELVLARRNADGWADTQHIPPVWNRLVAFETGDETWHGHPTPWLGPQPRRSLAVYYYTASMPTSFDPERETTFVA